MIFRVGSRPRIQAGSATEARMLLPCRGGIAISSRRVSPVPTFSSARARTRKCGAEEKVASGASAGKNSGAECGRTVGIRFADHAAPHQPAGITGVSVYPETAPVCRDCMVGDAGIELMAHPFKTRRRVADF